MRIDKFLKISRMVKRRTVAKEACEQGRVTINGKVAKPGDEVKVGDIIGLLLGENEHRAEVLSLQENIRKEDAVTLYRKI